MIVLNSVRVRLGPTTCCSAPPTTQHLRSRLERLRQEALSTTSKANSARLRLLRLSEAAENLQKQAATSIHRGDEDAARESLFQRSKVLQALDKSRNRIQLLDQLSAKLSQAICLKESQLIGNVSAHVQDMAQDDAATQVRIVAPKDDSDPDMVKLDQLPLESPADRLDGEDAENLRQSLNDDSWNEDNVVGSLEEISSYEDFVERIDRKLGEVEAELVTVLNVSTFVLDSQERPKNSRLQQTAELLESIRGIRQRIASITNKMGA